MIIVDPVALGDAACMRPSPKWVYDRTGTLVEVPADTLAVTYDPSDLSKAPYALIEPEARNVLTYSDGFNANWNRPGSDTAPGAGRGPNGQMSAVKLIAQASSGLHYLEQVPTIDAAKTYTRFWYIKAAEMQKVEFSIYSRPTTQRVVIAIFDAGTGELVVETARGEATQSFSAKALPDGWWRVRQIFTLGGTDVSCYCRVALLDQVTNNSSFIGDGASGLFIFGSMLVEGDRDESHITSGAVQGIRAADVIGPTAGLIYSNVPMVEPPYDAAVTYAKDALVRDPVTHSVYQSLIDANKGKLLTDEASWNVRGKTNRWAMFDEYNNTQTTNPEEIVVVLSPQSICEGLYLGNVDADEIELVVVDQSDGKVYSEVISLVTASGSSSYYDWCFRPADRADYYFTVAMPPYAAALVTVVLRKAGGVAKCGMAAIGLVDDFGPSLYGLSASGKDFSSTTFNFDGTSKTQLRDYAKQMNVDVQVNNGEIDYIQRKLFQLRQRPIVWIGGPYGATAVFGRYVSFDIVIPGLLKSDMSLQIEGSV